MTGSLPPGHRGELRGRLLIASPRLRDPNFDRTVVFILDHGDEGALGVVINRPTHAEVEDILEPWMAVAERTPPAMVFSGGPVSLNAVIGLGLAGADTDTPAVGTAGAPEDADAEAPEDADAEAPEDADAEAPEPDGLPWRSVVGPIGTVDLSVDPGRQPRALRGVRLFAGYAGWIEGQLETEMDAGAWFAVDGDVGDVFTSDPEQLWHDVLHRQAGQLAVLANYPPHPSVN
jgi:putative transcriptional regulator